MNCTNSEHSKLKSQMKKKIGLLVLVSVVIALCFSCGRDSSEHSKFDSLHRNETALDDSVYFGLNMHELDTMVGFKKFFQDTLNHHWLISCSRKLSQATDSSLNFPERFILRTWYKIFVLKSMKNQIRLSQKGPISMMATRPVNLGQIRLALRVDGSFDVHSQTWFRDELYEGTYRFKSDTLLLNFTTEKDDNLGDSLLLTDEKILTLNKSGSRWIDYYLDK